MPYLAQIASALAVLWVTWRFLRRRLHPTVLENVPGPPGESWIADGKVVRLKGAWQSDRLLVFDQKAMYHVLVKVSMILSCVIPLTLITHLKDYNIYEETDSFIDYVWSRNIHLNWSVHTLFKGLSSSDPLFTGDEHRRHRRMLNPVFSSAHMRQMVPIFYEVSHKASASMNHMLLYLTDDHAQVKDVFLNKVKNGPQEVDVVNWMTRLALELIGQSGLGYSFDELTETSPQHKYGMMSKKLVTMQGDEFVRDWVMPRLTRIGSPAFRKFLVDLMPFEAIAGMREIVTVLHDTSTLIFDTKKKALAAGDEAVANQIGRGKDIISILMKRNVLASDEDKLSDEEVLAQITSLTFAATDTTSGALSRILHQLAIRKDAQDRVREEIREARRDNGGQDIGYDDLATLPYLDAVCRETLRLTNEDVILPLSQPIKGINGEEIREIPLPKGTNVSVSLLAANRDPDLWGPDALEWKPERWLNPLPESLVEAHEFIHTCKEKLHQLVTVLENLITLCFYRMTFLGGGRSCLGFKFSQLEMKVVLTLLLENLEFSLSEKKIIWQMFAISTPNTDPDSVIPTMPMIISLAKNHILACDFLVILASYPASIPGPPAGSWITGKSLNLCCGNQIIYPMFKNNASANYLRTDGQVARTKGAFGANRLYLFDPKAMHHIFVKDQHIFEETDSFIEGRTSEASKNDQPRVFQCSHAPDGYSSLPYFTVDIELIISFNSAHILRGYPQGKHKAVHKHKAVKRVLIGKAQNGPQEIDIVSWMTRLAMELIGQSGLGYTFDDLTENGVQHQYVTVSKRLVTLQGNEFVRDIVMPKIARIGTQAFRKFVVDLTPFAAVKELRGIIKVIYDTSVEIFESKKMAIEKGDEAIAAQIGRGKDIISILSKDSIASHDKPILNKAFVAVKANMMASEDERLSDAEVVAQISSLTFAATDTTSGALSRIVHQLSIHKDVQSKLREEIREARKMNGGQDLGYDQLVSLPYLDALSTSVHGAKSDVILPLFQPIKDYSNNEIREIPLQKGTTVAVSILASNRNPDLWGPDAHEWKPERWLNPLPETLIAAHMPGIYSHLMTFLGGGRSCIGFKFSQLEMKVVISLLLENLEFSLGRKNIIWQMYAIAQPNIDPDSVNPTMPLIITAV
ncbi:LOW QUALITY PROTEIN: hypothetical protein CVT25_005092 [Psilocybe cyanescens]|uniref:Cytochrome P450 n=1 Tax=Psilocybe cyanescens TaxID=93625 RepID=A0A409XDY0_PSICY|nr:LOW QUALITY PROTEIN: hypothetical protein CVT25_005092 [Psilocybe cyanescens]